VLVEMASNFVGLRGDGSPFKNSCPAEILTKGDVTLTGFEAR
jgi:hypothetical protein